MIAGAGLKNNSTSLITFEEIYKENADRILNLAYRMTGKEELARDITQDVFMKVYENSDTFREQSKISTWIYRIAMNHIINLVRREKRLKFFNTLEKGFGSEANYDNAVTVWEENLPTRPDRVLEENEKEMIIRKMIDELAPKYKIPLLLFRYEDMSYKEIADQLNISVSAVESQIHRAKKKLAEKLKPWIKSL
jgi:RNA polymerase sigma-70 factor, ECF subfamily